MQYNELCINFLEIIALIEYCLEGKTNEKENFKNFVDI